MSIKIIENDAMLELAKMPDKLLDLVLCDPPYDFDEETKKAFHNEFMRVCRGPIVVYSPPENRWIIDSPGYEFQQAYWTKPISTKNTSRRLSRFVEEIFIYTPKDFRHTLGLHWSMYTNIFTDIVEGTSGHQWEKPTASIRRLMQLYAGNNGGTVLDPFAGSGVVGKVARELGFNAILIESDEKWVSYMEQFFNKDKE